MSGLRYIAQGGVIVLIIFCMTIDLCVAATTNTTAPPETDFDNVKGQIESLYKSCNETACKEFSDLTQLSDVDKACRELEALKFCTRINTNCQSPTSHNLYNCKSPKQRVIDTLADLKNKCEGKCDSLFEDVKKQDTLDETCGKVDSLDYCLSINCDYFNAYKPTLDDAHKICDGCVYHGVSVCVFLLGLVLSKWWTL